LDLLGHVLGGGKTSRLHRALVREKQIAQDVQAYEDGQELTSDFGIVATVRPGHTIAEVEAAIAEEIARIKAEPPTADEMERAVNTFEARVIRSLEPVGGFGGRADQLNQYNTFTGDPGYMVKDFDRYTRIDALTVQEMAKKYLGPGRVVVEVTPGSEVTIEPNPLVAADAARAEMAKKLEPLPSFSPQVAAEGTGRDALPEGAAEPKFSLPPIQRAKLANGMQVLLVEKHELPVVNIHVVFPTGRVDDPVLMPGLADMFAAVWDEGTEKRTSDEIASQLGDIGATLGVSADWDTTGVRLFSLKRQLPRALDILFDVLRHPTFPEKEVHRQQLASLARLSQIRNEPTVLASMAATQLIYGSDRSGYGHPQWGNSAVIKEITRDQLKQHYDCMLAPSEAVVIAVGDITMAELTPQLEPALGDWQRSGTGPSGGYEPHPQKPTRLVLIDKPHAAQSVIHIALLGSRRKTPDYFPQSVMNTVFGGQFSSRLNLNLREQKGYTYGARSSWDWRVRSEGLYVATSSVQTNVTAPALTEFLKELKDMAGERPVEAKELEFCRKYVTRGYTAGFETPSHVASQLETLVAYQLPDNYFNTVVPGIQAVTADDVMRVAKKYLDLDRLAIVVVGDRAKVEPELRKLPVGKDLKVYRFDEAFKLEAVE
jgi:zinc protease